MGQCKAITCASILAESDEGVVVHVLSYRELSESVHIHNVIENYISSALRVDLYTELHAM